MKIIWERSDFSDARIFASRVHAPEDLKDLKFSHYMYSIPTEQITHKTCTNCSQDEGRFVWHPIDSFSHRIIEGRVRPQPQCAVCRGPLKDKLKRPCS